jgi:hypothetical protein
VATSHFGQSGRRLWRSAPRSSQVKTNALCAVAKRVEAVVSGTFVGIDMRENSRTCDEGEDEEDEAEAYFPGGTFNGPIFDACWVGSSPFIRGAGEELPGLQYNILLRSALIYV